MKVFTMMTVGLMLFRQTASQTRRRRLPATVIKDDPGLSGYNKGIIEMFEKYTNLKHTGSGFERRFMKGGKVYFKDTAECAKFVSKGTELTIKRDENKDGMVAVTHGKMLYSVHRNDLVSLNWRSEESFVGKVDFTLHYIEKGKISKGLTLKVHELRVTENYRGTGMFKIFIAIAVQYAKDNGINLTEIQLTPDQIGVRPPHLYYIKKLGFKVCEEKDLFEDFGFEKAPAGYASPANFASLLTKWFRNDMPIFKMNQIIKVWFGCAKVKKPYPGYEALKVDDKVTMMKTDKNGVVTIRIDQTGDEKVSSPVEIDVAAKDWEEYFQPLRSRNEGKWYDMYYRGPSPKGRDWISIENRDTSGVFGKHITCVQAPTQELVSFEMSKLSMVYKVYLEKYWKNGVKEEWYVPAMDLKLDLTKPMCRMLMDKIALIRKIKRNKYFTVGGRARCKNTSKYQGFNEEGGLEIVDIKKDKITLENTKGWKFQSPQSKLISLNVYEFEQSRK